MQREELHTVDKGEVVSTLCLGTIVKNLFLRNDKMRFGFLMTASSEARIGLKELLATGVVELALCSSGRVLPRLCGSLCPCSSLFP